MEIIQGESLVSIIMPAYNSELYIGKSIESVLHQSYTNRELIIIDDGSTDATPYIVSEYAKSDPRIILLQNTSNLNICLSSNKGLEYSKGCYIARLDSDDIWYPHKLKTQIKFMIENPDYQFTSTSFEYIDEDGNITGKYIGINEDKKIKNCLIYTCPMLQGTFVFHRKLYENYGGYDNNRLFTEDNELVLRYGLHTKFYNIPDVLFQYRRHKNNISKIKHRAQLLNALKLCYNYRNKYPNFLKGIIIRLTLYILPLSISSKLHKLFLLIFRS